MGRSKRFKEAYDYLKKKGIIHTKSQLGEMMEYTRAVVSNAYNGKDEYANDKFLSKFCNCFPNTFNYEWLVSGEGKMLQAPDVTQEPVKAVEVSDDKDETIKGLRAQNMALINTINKLIDELASLRADINAIKAHINIQTYNVASNDVNPAVLNDKLNKYK